MDTLNFLGMLYVDFATIGVHAILLVIVSAILTDLLKRTTHKIPRSTYFLNTSLVTFAGSISQFIWVAVFGAIANDYVFLIAAIDITVWLTVGYVLIMLSKARSNDAFGSSGYAALGFIPIANFVLLLKPSMDTTTQPAAKSATFGAPAVIIGFIVLGLGRAAGMEAEKAVEHQVSSLPQTENAQSLSDHYYQFYDRKDGLAAGLEYLASLEKPGRIDEITDLVSVSVKDDVLTYDFVITDSSVTGFNIGWVGEVQAGNCITFAMAIKNGGSVRFVYKSQQNGELENILSDLATCS